MSEDIDFIESFLIKTPSESIFDEKFPEFEKYFILLILHLFGNTNVNLKELILYIV